MTTTTARTTYEACCWTVAEAYVAYTFDDAATDERAHYYALLMRRV
jgi:hypothetical protein